MSFVKPMVKHMQIGSYNFFSESEGTNGKNQSFRTGFVWSTYVMTIHIREWKERILTSREETIMNIRIQSLTLDSCFSLSCLYGVHRVARCERRKEKKRSYGRKEFANIVAKRTECFPPVESSTNASNKSNLDLLGVYCACLRCLFLFLCRIMNRATPPTTDSDTSSLNGDFIDIDIGANAAEMSDGEILSEIKALHPGKALAYHTDTKFSVSKTMSDTTLATPKIPSAVVIPESSLSNRSKVEEQRSWGELEFQTKKPRRNRNGKGSANDKTSDNSLAAFLSKVKMSSARNDSKPVEDRTSNFEASTPKNSKRIHSAGTTPENCKSQPGKLAKLEDVIKWETLNLKVCMPQRPPTGKELQTIKQFLQYQIEAALSNREKFIPLFTEPCKIERDGVYVYCSDLACTKWLKCMVIPGIPDVSGVLTVLPQDTPLKLDPNFVMVRIVVCIPTRKPGDQILNNLAQLNKDLNTERWCIKRIRPKGSSKSMVFMRIDKQSYDTIASRNGKVNWILGPIYFEIEGHRSRKKSRQNPTSGSDKPVDTNNLMQKNHGVQPPSNRSVDKTLSRDGGSNRKGVIKAVGVSQHVEKGRNGRPSATDATRTT